MKQSEFLAFQFPSGGKVYSDREMLEAKGLRVTFQFPSGGKVYSDIP